MTPSVDIDPDRLRLRRLATSELTAGEVREIRALMDVAFGSEGEEERFSDDDWQHALGGVHFVLELDGEIVAHAAVVERQLYVGGLPLRTGYVEAVATSPDRQGLGLGSIVMTDVTRVRPGGLRARRTGNRPAIVLRPPRLAHLGWPIRGADA